MRKDRVMLALAAVENLSDVKDWEFCLVNNELTVHLSGFVPALKGYPECKGLPGYKVLKYKNYFGEFALNQYFETYNYRFWSSDVWGPKGLKNVAQVKKLLQLLLEMPSDLRSLEQFDWVYERLNLK